MRAEMQPRCRRLTTRALLVATAVLIGTVAVGVLGCTARPAPPPLEDTLAGMMPTERIIMADDSGLFLVWKNYFAPQIKDPLSLEHIRDCYHHAGFRAVRQLEDELARAGLVPVDALAKRIDIAKLYLYEGDAANAAAVLAQVRAAAEADDRLKGWVPPLAFLQGVAALRRAENENCVECTCESSCIFPLRPEAVHQQKEGARQAIGFFTEFLQFCPYDLGGRWLLNIAYMTLGEYPDRVPARHLIPPSLFQSGGDMGRFTDVAPRLGVDRLDQAGGAIMDDFDNDGLLDIIETSMDPRVPMAFYRNRGDGTFEERGRAAGLASQLGGLYCVQTDYNNDGFLDIYVCRGAWSGLPMRHSLLRNNGNGTFTDVTREAGLAEPMDGQVVAWADFDLDGRLDVFVGGELVPSRLYRNRGDGTFEDVTAKAGLDMKGRQCKGVTWGDFDGDGYPDLFFCDFKGKPVLYHNNGDGTFTDVTDAMGIDGPRGCFSCWFFDYDNDGWPDIFVGILQWDLHEVLKSYLRQNYQGETWRLYRNKGGRGFEDVTRAVGLDLGLPVMGCNFADLDNDGFLDIYLGTGGPPYSMLLPKLMFRNDQGRRFVDVTASSRTGHLQKGHAVACGDWDRDGNLDMFVQLGGATPGDAFRNVLFQNPGGHGNHWINVKLAGRTSNRPGIGARIKVVPAGADAKPIYRWVNSGSSFGGNPLEQHIGIGKADKIAALEVYWPASKTTQTFRDLSVDQHIEITEGDPTFRRLHRPRLPSPLR